MSNLIPLPEPERTPDHDTGPEALLISALLATGQFDPARHGVGETDLAAHRKCFRFCLDYQRRAGSAPPLELVRSRFPDFTFTGGVNPVWAAGQVREAAWQRSVRAGIRDVLVALGEGDHATASGLLSALSAPRPGTKLEGVDVFDKANVAERVVKAGIPVPFPTLQQASGGIGREVWTLGARWGVGKSYLLAYFAAYAAEHRRVVRMLSLEMPAAQYNLRVARTLARNNPSLREALTSHRPADREEALELIGASIEGKVQTIDPSHARITTAVVEEATDGADLVVIDHAGLLCLHDGRRAIEDWRVAAQISNQIKEIQLRTGTPILQAVQVNREGDGERPPKGSQLSQTDAFGQDSDLVLAASRYSESVLAHAVRKNREGAQPSYYTRFDPVAGQYPEISKADAEAIKQRETEAAARVRA